MAIRTLAALFVLLATLFAPAHPASAQTAQPPPALSQQQLDQLVDSISKSVIEKLKAEQGPPASGAADKPSGQPATQQPAKPASRSPFDAAAADEPDETLIFLRQAADAVRAAPEFVHYLGAFRSALDDSPNGGLGRRTYLLLLLLVVVVAVSVEVLLRQVLHPWRARLAANAVPERGLRSLGNVGLLALLDGFCVLAFWLVGRAGVVLWFGGASIQDRFAVALLTAVLLWRLYSLVFRIVLQPGLASARLCDMTDSLARRAYRLMSGFVLFAILLRLTYYVVVAMQASPQAIAAGRVLTAPVLLLVLVWISIRTREAARQWFGGLGKAAPVVGFIGRNWAAVTIAFFTAVIATQLYGAITGRTGVPEAVMLTLNLAVALLLFETLLQAVVRRLDSQLQGFTPAGNQQKLPDVVARCLRVAVLIGILVALSESWVVDVLRLVDERAWVRLTRAGRAAGITVFVAYVVWELFRYATEAYVARVSERNRKQGDAAVNPATGAVATRFDTLMPMIRVVVAVIIGIVALLVALDDLGINIGPLLAGASVLGLAVSFGSQTLVRDIVSGIFYLADDAFRVGEYIDCGRAKGTVEGFTLRSIRLRHQNGQVHTIPFGSLGQITNFSRDWTAVKFNLPFARNTDLDKLRKAAKTIGADMMEEPEFKADLLKPFKMQGVADVTDTALVVRFKFTARPGNPSAIQNQAVTRLLKALPELGIELSQPVAN